MHELSLVQRVIIWALPVLFAITVHEVAHGWIAKRLGDPTAERLGRLTLNPVKHIDPIGTVVVPGLLLLFGPFVFGWAKPVPITWNNLRRPRRDMALVAAAGPGANLLMAAGWAGVIKLGLGLQAPPLVLMGSAGVLINAVLMVLNLLPLPPLDGGRVLSGVLPPRWAWRLDRIEPYGLFILLALLVTGLLGKIMQGPIMLLLELLSALSGVPVRFIHAALA